MIELKDFLDALSRHGDLLQVDGAVNWSLEVAAYSAMSNRTGAQAILFKKISGYPETFSLATNLFSGPPLWYQFDDPRSPWGRIATGLGLDPKVRYEELMGAILDRLDHPIFPVELKEGVCKEVVRTGGDVNLFELPLPLLHKEDGGRYGTGHVLVVKDPDSDWHNWSVNRWMPVGPDTLVVGFDISSHAKEIVEKYLSKGEPAPFAIVIGGAPAIVMAATMKLPPLKSEVDTAGGLNLDPINLIKAETVDMFVPADAEVVIEGEFIPGEVAEEGPYGAFMGYTKRTSQPLGVVKAITMRKNPIIPIVVDGTWPSDTEWLISIFESARLFGVLTRRYQHPIRWISIIPDFALGICVVSMMNMYYGQAFRVARHIFVNSNLFDKVIFVDSDLEPMSLQGLTTRIHSRAHPTRSLHTMDGYPPTPLQWYITREEIEKGQGAGRMYIDTCWPAHWGPEDKPTSNCFEVVFPKEIKDKVAERWKEYGFKEEAIILPEGSVFEG